MTLTLFNHNDLNIFSYNDIDLHQIHTKCNVSIFQFWLLISMSDHTLMKM